MKTMHRINKKSLFAEIFEVAQVTKRTVTYKNPGSDTYSRSLRESKDHIWVSNSDVAREYVQDKLTLRLERQQAIAEGIRLRLYALTAENEGETK